MSFRELQQIPKPVTIALALFNLPTRKPKGDKLLLTIEELAQKRIPGQWNVSVVDLVTILDDLPEGYEMIVTRNGEQV